MNYKWNIISKNKLLVEQIRQVINMMENRKALIFFKLGLLCCLRVENCVHMVKAIMDISMEQLTLMNQDEVENVTRTLIVVRT